MRMNIKIATNQAVTSMPSLRDLLGMFLRTYRTWKLERDIAQAKKEQREGKTIRIKSPEDVDRLLS